MKQFIKRIIQCKNIPDVSPHITALNVRVARLQTQDEEFLAKYSQLQTQNEEFLARCYALQSQYKALQERYDTINNQYSFLQSSYWALENYRVELQKNHYDLVNHFHTLENRIQDQLKHLEKVIVPSIAYFYSTKATGNPIVFEDSDHLLFECDALNLYLLYVNTQSIIDDPKLVRYLKRVVEPGETIIDVGANIGGIALLCGKLVGESGRVFAIEAEAITAKLLWRNIALNHMERWVTSVHAAVYSSNTTLMLNVFERDASVWNTLGWFEMEYAPIGTQQVHGITLDDFCEQHSIERIDLLKVDVEGAEPDVFAGAKAILLRQTARKIVFEISKVPLEGMGHQVEEVIQPLQEAGYTLYQIDAQGDLRQLDLATLKSVFFANFVALSPRSK